MKIHELGHVVLYVTNAARVAAFYRDVLGFKQIISEAGIALFSAGRTHHEMLLIEVGGQPQIARGVKPGLYHIGFKIGDYPEDLKKAYGELKANNVHIIGATDHGVTHSLYILDPDGNELELYADVSDVWKTNPQAILAPPKPLYLD